MNNNIDSIFSSISNETEKTYKSNNIYNDNQEIDKSLKEQRILNKLSLRKKKIEEVISSKRSTNIINTFKALNDGASDNINNYISTEHEIIVYTKNDFISGDIFRQLSKAYELKDVKNINEIIRNIVNFFQNKKLDNIEIIELFMKSGCNICNNNFNNIKEKFPFALLLLNIGLATEDKFIYIYCFNFILNFTFISNEFCQEITDAKIINLILEKLIHFYPLFIVNDKVNSKENIESNDLNNIQSQERVESFYIGGQILKLLGNLFISSENYDSFEINNFYDKVFYLLYIFDFNEKEAKYKNIYFEFLETLIWLVYSFLEKEENFILNFKDKLLMAIPCLLKDIKMLYFTQATDLLEKILDLIDYLSSINSDFNAQILDAEGIKILSNLFAYLFNNNNGIKNCEIILNASIIDKIIDIFTNIFTLDSKNFKYCDDYLNFSLVIEKLISIYKVHAKNHFETQHKLIVLLSNLACFEDIEDIVRKFMLNKNIIKDLFKYYNQNHKDDIILYIDNVIEKQTKKVRDFILELGGFDIIKDNICNFNESNIDVVKQSIKALHKLIQKEKAFNIRLLFEKLYNTAIPEKIKELACEKNMEDVENMIHFIVNDFDIYEKSLEED